MIYTFPSCKTPDELDSLWQQVTTLSRLRHENLQLFMGAVVAPVPCIITCMKKGPTLYEKIHVQKEFLSRTYKISIAKQVSQCIGYLSAKDIEVNCSAITSHHIILENKVKLCLVDIEARINHKSCPCVPCASTMGLISCFVRSPFNVNNNQSSILKSKFMPSSMDHDFNVNNHRSFHRHPSPPSSPRHLGLSNDALDCIGKN